MTNKRILITGATGLIGSAITSRFRPGYQVTLTARSEEHESPFPYLPFDLNELEEIPAFLDKLKPEVIVHTAAIGSVDYAELNKEEAKRLNVDATEQIAQWCGKHSARLIHFSTDFVFDGSRLNWKEGDTTAPISWYGKTKVLSEECVMKHVDDHVILRPILVFGTAARARRLNLPLLILAKLNAKEAMRITHDQVRQPTYVDDVAWAVEQLLDHPFRGILHLSGPEALDVYSFSKLTAEVFELDDRLLQPVDTDFARQTGKRPMKSGFDLRLAAKVIGFRPTSPRKALMKMRETLRD